MNPPTTTQQTLEEVRVEPINDDDRDRLRDLVLQLQNLVADDD